MENSTPFDLDQALLQWRASLQNLGGFQAEELEELEGHLRESISNLQTKGLGSQEAFMIAVRRLGSERQLSAEFAKVEPQRIWTERAMWMVAGVLVAYTLTAVSTPFKSIVLNCAIWSGLNGNLVGALHLLAGWILWAPAAAATFWIFSRHSARLDGVVQACLQRPVLSGLGLFLGLECLQYGTRYASRLAEPVYSFFSGHPAASTQPNAAVFDLYLFWGYFVTQVLWVIAGPVLVGYAWRKRERFAFETSSSYEVQLGEDEAARTLQGQGLSLDEANLVLAQRRCSQEVDALSFAPATVRSIWLERASWMVVGVALNRCLEMFVLNMGWLPLMVTHPAAPLYQHLTGLTSACLSLVLGGALIAVLWRWVTRHPRQIGLIGNLCCRRPLLSAFALVLICAVVGGSEYGLFVHVVPREVLRGPSSIGPIATQWFTYSGALTHLIIPIALLLWLARRWRSTQTDPEPCR
jgi:hypothetical protein